MLVKIIISVTITCAFAQRMPIMPPSAGKQDTVSFPELIAMMAMRNQLPTGDQTYTLLNLTGGRPLPSVPSQPTYPLQTQPQNVPQVPLPAPVQQQRQPPRPQQTPVRSNRAPVQQQRQPPRPQQTPVRSNRAPVQQQRQMTPVDIQSAVQSAVSAALPSAVQTAVEAATPVQPQVSQADIQKAVQSAISAALPSVVKAVAPAPAKSSSAMDPAAIQSAINLAVKAAVGANPAAKATPAATPAGPLDIQSMINAAMKSATSGSTKPKHTGPPPACSGTCPPKWLATVRGFTGEMKAGHAMCKFTKFMTPCETPNAACKPGYSCCPISCLSTIVGCYQGPPLKFACLPDDITPWWPEMVQTYMQTYGMGGAGGGAGMGGAMGQPMGGPMGGMMGGMGAMMGF